MLKVLKRENLAETISVMYVTRKLEHVQTSTENFHGTLGGRLTLKQATSNLKYMFKVVLSASHDVCRKP